MKNSELIAFLKELPEDLEVRVWLPGSHILVSKPFVYKNRFIFIEGNIVPGSALDEFAKPDERRAFMEMTRNP